VVAKTSVDVVILSVHVRGDSPADGDLPGTGGDRDEPSLWKALADEFVNGNARTHGDFAARVHGGNTAELAVDHNEATGELGSVTVATPQATGDCRGAGVQMRRDVVRALRFDDGGRTGCRTSPAVENLPTHA